MALYFQSVTLDLVQGEDFKLEVYRYNNIQTITVSAAAGAYGTFTLTFQGRTTVPIKIGATAAAVQAALVALPTIGDGNVTVSGSAGGPWTVTWAKNLATALQPLLAWAWGTVDDPAATIAIGAQPRDVHLYTAKAKWKDAPGGAGTTYATLTATSGTDGQVILSDGAAGHVTVYIKTATTTAAAAGTTGTQLDLQLIDGSGLVEAWLSASVNFKKSVI